MFFCIAEEEPVSPSKQRGSPSKQQGGTFGGLFGSGGDRGSGSQGGSGGGASSWLPTWAGGAKQPEEKVGFRGAALLLLFCPLQCCRCHCCCCCCCCCCYCFGCSAVTFHVLLILLQQLFVHLLVCSNIAAAVTLDQT